MSDNYIYVNGDNGVDDYIMMSYPSNTHEGLIGEYYGQFWQYFRGCSRCIVRGSNTGLFLGHRWDMIKHLKSVQDYFADTIQAGNERKISITPDLMVICDWAEDDFDGKGYHGIPKIVGEFWSPSTWRSDITWKKDIYEAIGVQEYWIILDETCVEVYDLIDGEYEKRSKDLIKGENGLNITCSFIKDLTIKINKDMFL